MDWIRKNGQLITIILLIAGLIAYIYNSDKASNAKEHEKIETKIDKIIEQMDNNKTQRFDRYEQMISDLQDSLKHKK